MSPRSLLRLLLAPLLLATVFNTPPGVAVGQSYRQEYYRQRRFLKTQTERSSPSKAPPDAFLTPGDQGALTTQIPRQERSGLAVPHAVVASFQAGGGGGIKQHVAETYPHICGAPCGPFCRFAANERPKRAGIVFSGPANPPVGPIRGPARHYFAI